MGRTTNSAAARHKSAVAAPNPRAATHFFALSVVQTTDKAGAAMSCSGFGYPKAVRHG